MQLHVIVASTREGRAGRPIAEWFVGRASAHGKFSVELVDLKESSNGATSRPAS
jgi:NAD(P)H-dependent FMN reductase